MLNDNFFIDQLKEGMLCHHSTEGSFFRRAELA